MKSERRVLLTVVERHADEAAFLFERRERAARSMLFDLPRLAAMDDRLLANLEGLVLAEGEGLRLAVEALDRAARTTSRPEGELFTAAHVAAELAENVAFSRFIVRGEGDRGLAHALACAIAWLGGAAAARVLPDLGAEGCPPALHLLAIAAAEERRQDPGALLDRALRSEVPALRAAASRAAGHLGRRDLVPALRLAADDPDPEASGWARWSAVLLGDRVTAEGLWDVAAGPGGAALAAADLAARVADPASRAARIGAALASDGSLGYGLCAAAAAGDPVHVPALLDRVEGGVAGGDPSIPLRAAVAYATITGAPLAPPLFVRERSGERLVQTFGSDLPAPVAAELRAHWDRVRASFAPGERFLGGRRIEAGWLGACLVEGLQPLREAAALERCVAGPGAVLFPVHAPGPVQRGLLAPQNTSGGS